MAETIDVVVSGDADGQDIWRAKEPAGTAGMKSGIAGSSVCGCEGSRRTAGDAVASLDLFAGFFPNVLHGACAAADTNGQSSLVADAI